MQNQDYERWIPVLVEAMKQEQSNDIQKEVSEWKALVKDSTHQ